MGELKGLGQKKCWRPFSQALSVTSHLLPNPQIELSPLWLATQAQEKYSKGLLYNAQVFFLKGNLGNS